MDDRASEVDVVVVGAGAAGLAAGRRLSEAQVSVVVLEARRRTGGRGWTVPTALGPAIDLGCEWLHSADRNPFTAIARRRGLAIDERLPDWRSRVARRHGDAAQAAWAQSYGAFEERMDAMLGQTDVAASALLEPSGRWNPLIDAISTWANGVELDRLSVEDHRRYSDSGINWRVLEGYGTLIAAYGEGVPTRLGAVVQRIDHGGRRIAVETTCGTVAARALISCKATISRPYSPVAACSTSTNTSSRGACVSRG
jgi:monoamine oxidase